MPSRPLDLSKEEEEEEEAEEGEDSRDEDDDDDDVEEVEEAEEGHGGLVYPSPNPILGRAPFSSVGEFLFWRWKTIGPHPSYLFIAAYEPCRCVCLLKLVAGLRKPVSHSMVFEGFVEVGRRTCSTSVNALRCHELANITVGQVGEPAIGTIVDEIC